MGRGSHGATSVVAVWVLWCLSACHGGLSWNNSVTLSVSNYNDAIGKAILFFDGQRSGKLPTSQRVQWRADSALADGSPENVDLAGGYYDAGDNVKFTGPMSFAVSLLSWTAIDYQPGISSIGQLGFLQTAIRWGTDFLLKAHTSPTTLYTQVIISSYSSYIIGWRWEFRPSVLGTTGRYGHETTLYKITANSPGSEPAGDAAAALAAASIVFKGVDPGYSSNLLSSARSLFEFADKYRGSYQGSCPFYCSYSGYQDELLWAAAWLYKATGEDTYLNYVVSNQGWSQPSNEFSWDNKFIGAQAVLAKEFYQGKSSLGKFKTDTDSFVCSLMPGSNSAQIKTTPGGLLYTRDSSNLQYVSSSTMVLLAYSRTLDSAGATGVQCGSVRFSASQIKAFAQSQVDYVLGKNPMKMSYMVGFGTKFPLRVHHRGASIPSIRTHPAKFGCNDGMSVYYYSSNPNPNTHTGAVVGGPDSNDNFNDARTDYAHSEPITYTNAAFVGCLAALL